MDKTQILLAQGHALRRLSEIEMHARQARESLLMNIAATEHLGRPSVVIAHVNGNGRMAAKDDEAGWRQAQSLSDARHKAALQLLKDSTDALFAGGGPSDESGE